MQKLPLHLAPHDGQNHSSDAPGAGAGLGEPQLVQKLPVLEAPHEQVQAPATGDAPAAPAAIGAVCWGWG